jgi:hypothetical protein
MEYEDVRHMLVSVHRNLVVGLPRAGLSLSTLTFLDALCLETAPRLRLLEAAMTAPNPVQLLREAGVEVPESVRFWDLLKSSPDGECGPCRDAFLALVELVKELEAENESLKVCFLCRYYSDGFCLWCATPHNGLAAPTHPRCATCRCTPSRWEQHRGK